MKRSALFWTSLVAILITMYLVFVFVPTEREMGIVQRIFYLMVPVGWIAMLAFFVVFLGSVLFLYKKDRKWDILARCSAEIGLLFTTLTLIAGSLWAKPVWGVWWTWEARLTTTLILWVIYIAYFMVRSLATEEHRGAVFAAVVSVIGLVDLPIIALSTTLWPGIHPGGLVFTQGGLAPSMLITLIVSIVSFTLLYAVLMVQRVSMKTDEMELEKLKQLLSETRAS